MCVQLVGCETWFCESAVLRLAAVWVRLCVAARLQDLHLQLSGAEYIP